MAEPQVSWANGLSPSLRVAFEWAQAASGGRAKVPEVGTAALLVGIVRSHEGYSEPEALLQHFGRTREQLFDALVASAREPRHERPVELAPTVQRRSPLKDFPPLNPPVRQAIDLARGRETHSDGSLHLPTLFGALLDLDGTHAYEALGRVVGSVVPLEEIRNSYYEWLAEGGKRLYPSFLAERYPGGRPPGDGDGGGDADRTRPPYLVAVETSAGVRGTGVATSAGVLTATVLLEQATADSRQALVFGDAGSAQTELAESASGVALLRPTDGALPVARSDLAVLGAVPPLPESTVTIWYSKPEGWQTAEATVVGPVDGGRLVRLSAPLDPALAGGAVLDGGRLVGIIVTPGEDVTEAATERILTAPPFAAVGTLGGAGNDRVAIEDSLGFDQYVEAFCDLIASPYTKPPLTIGIYGAWGMGKSFLLQNIEDRLRKRAKSKRPPPRPAVHVVSFNAWEYSANEVIWPGLVRKILSVLERETSNWFTKIWRRLRRNAGRQLKVARGRIIASLTLLIAAGVAVYFQSQFSTGALIAIVGALGVGGVVKFASDTLSDPLGQWFTALFDDAGYGAQIGYMEEIKNDLDKLQERLGDGRILVVIDDLDRCEPDKAVEVLQAINLLLTFESFIVCLGIDARVITRAIERHYRDLLAEAGASGYEYLEKIVQIPFRIPDPSDDDVMLFLLKQLGDPKPDGRPLEDQAGVDGDAPDEADEAADRQPPAELHGPPAEPGDGEAGPVDDHGQRPREHEPEPAGERPPVPFTWGEYRAFETLTPYLRHNPRRLKRLVNVYRLVRTLAAREGNSIVYNDPLATIRWLALADQWPYTASAILHKFESLLDEWDEELSKAPAVDPLTYLSEEIKPVLSTEKQRVLDDDAEVLKELVECPDGRLSWEQLVAMRRYTVNFNPAIEEEMRAGLVQPEAPGVTNGSQPREAVPA